MTALEGEDWVPDITTVRMAEAIHSDAMLRFRGRLGSLPVWSELDRGAKEGLYLHARALAEGALVVLQVDTIARELATVEIQDIPTALAILAERYTKVMGTVPEIMIDN